MTSHLNFKNIALFLSVIFLLTSFKDNEEKKSDETPAVTTNTAAVSDAVTATSTTTPDAPPLEGILDSLWIETTEFDKVRNGRKLVFSFTFRDPDTLTLYGWICQNKRCNINFVDTPIVKLKKGKPSGVKYGPNVILGNVIIAKNDIGKIKDKYRNTEFNAVVFVPKDKVDDYIRYKVYVIRYDAAKIRILESEDTGVELNPSPPKN